MKISGRTFNVLAKVVTGDCGLTPYRSGPVLVQLFNEFGSNDAYGQGFPSRWKYAEDKLRALNGTSTLRELINTIFDTREFLDKNLKLEPAVQHVNQYLKFDGYELAMDSGHYKVREIGKVAGKPNSSTPQPPAGPQSLVSRETLAALRTRFLQISKLRPQDRGYALEKFLYDLFNAYHFDPRPSFRIMGEQIDGSIEFEHEIYLVEAKWQVEPIVQGDLAVLDSRVSGHSQIGRGIFITAGCFSVDGVTAYERLRPSAMIGIDGQDLYFLIEHALPLAEILRRKLRWLVETGHFHYPVREFVMELEKR